MILNMFEQVKINTHYLFYPLLISTSCFLWLNKIRNIVKRNMCCIILAVKWGSLSRCLV